MLEKMANFSINKIIKKDFQLIREINHPEKKWREGKERKDKKSQ